MAFRFTLLLCPMQSLLGCGLGTVHLHRMFGQRIGSQKLSLIVYYTDGIEGSVGIVHLCCKFLYTISHPVSAQCRDLFYRRGGNRYRLNRLCGLSRGVRDHRSLLDCIRQPCLYVQIVGKIIQIGLGLFIHGITGSRFHKATLTPSHHVSGDIQLC